MIFSGLLNIAWGFYLAWSNCEAPTSGSVWMRRLGFLMIHLGGVTVGFAVCEGVPDPIIEKILTDLRAIA